MRQQFSLPLAALILSTSLTLSGVCPKAVAQDVKEQSLGAPHGVAINMTGDASTVGAELQAATHPGQAPQPSQSPSKPSAPQGAHAA